MRIYLRLGEQVYHLRNQRWGAGEVVEERHSTLSGGTCIAKVAFEDGEERLFLNDLESEMCCYYAGLRRAGPLFL